MNTCPASYGGGDGVPRYGSSSGMCQWLSVSSLLHACLIVPFILFSLHSPARHMRSRLQIELFGMVADRQVAEKKVAQQAAPQRREAYRPPKTVTYRTVATESPVSVHKTEEKPKPVEPETKPAPAAAVAVQSVAAAQVTTSGADAERQRQQSIRTAAEQEADRKRRYGEKVTKRLRSNVVYPKEARRMGIVAVTQIYFWVTESGQIKDGSLRVKRSSGYAALDASALKAARDSAPFEKPPNEMPLIVDINFDVKT
ncbi:energy transducer TonB [Geobacter sp. FeAm09]|uniref:energy transducer TonB n=1 Tax=Geobacter sp. FeAm09 TaxID=2597769 RepID=UPI0011EBDA37|nr:energy transducer TonB [Geobacter sp. FeAm09]QEM68590.1 energy transducer TonB [Geobacter sp. FeAm09]